MMPALKIEGGTPLNGRLKVQGSKNSALPILAAAVLSRGGCGIRNCPRLSDVESAGKILDYLGCRTQRDGDVVFVDAAGFDRVDIPDRLMREMRSSVIFLGAILGRAGEAVMSYPGGCELGPRPIDLHLSALRAMGVDIREEGGMIICAAAKLKGANISLAFPSVGATENIMLAATAAEGTTRIQNAAAEPEIVDLQNFLSACGAKIRGAGTNMIEIEGAGRLHACDHNVIPDRIVTVTYLCAAAAAGGDVLLEGADPSHLDSVLSVLTEAGLCLEICDGGIRATKAARLARVGPVRTMPYPGFPTDAQAPLMAAMATARGCTVFVENIFDNRYRHVGELVRMGADIRVEGRVAVVNGIGMLSGAPVDSTDLRGGAALVVAALSAEGETRLRGIGHIDRGYESIETALSGLGSKIGRFEEYSETT